MWIIRKLGSLTFAIIISVCLIVILIISTTLESNMGTPLAQKAFYQARWFDFFLSLLWINIFCSTILRFPFKRHHIGFLVTHIGILGLLMGALVTRLVGFEGQMMLAEGEASNKVKQSGYELVVDLPKGKTMSLDLAEKYRQLPLPMSGLKVFLHKTFQHATEELVISEGNPQGPKRLGLSLHLSSQTMGVNQSIQLVEKSHDLSDRDQISVGPLMVVLKKQKEEKAIQEPMLILKDADGKELVQVKLNQPWEQEIALSSGNLKIVNLKYLSRARVVENKLTDVSEGPLNPAVDFEIVGADGKKERVIKFAMFPEFESMHKEGQEKIFNLTTVLNVPEDGSQGSSGPALNFIAGKDGKWMYQAISKDGSVKEGAVNLNEPTLLGWMDMSFTVDKIFLHAVPSYEITESANTKQGVYALQLVAQDGENSYEEWLTEGKRMGFHAQAGDIYFELKSAQKEMPFHLTLKDFREKTYPGTKNPSSFESDVILDDPLDKVRIERTISMNNPLDYKGYRIFQSSFIRGTNEGESSIFTVAKNPGITLIYVSSCVLFLGACFQFFGRPLAQTVHGQGRKA